MQTKSFTELTNLKIKSREYRLYNSVFNTTKKLSGQTRSVK